MQPLAPKNGPKGSIGAPNATFGPQERPERFNRGCLCNLWPPGTAQKVQSEPPIRLWSPRTARKLAGRIALSTASCNLVESVEPDVVAPTRKHDRVDPRLLKMMPVRRVSAGVPGRFYRPKPHASKGQPCEPSNSPGFSMPPARGQSAPPTAAHAGVPHVTSPPPPGRAAVHVPAAGRECRRRPPSGRRRHVPARRPGVPPEASIMESAPHFRPQPARQPTRTWKRTPEFDFQRPRNRRDMESTPQSPQTPRQARRRPRQGERSEAAPRRSRAPQQPRGERSDADPQPLTAEPRTSHNSEPPA